MDSAGPRPIPRTVGRGRGQRSSLRPALLASGLVTACALTFIAPLAVGSVHEPAILFVTIAAALALCLLLAAEVLGGRSIRLTRVALLPLVLLCVPLLQSLPLPAAVS